MTTSCADGVLAVTVTAESVLRDVCVFPDRLAVVLGLPPHALTSDTSLVTLLPGETHTFRLTTRDGSALREARIPEPVLRTAVRSAEELTGPDTSETR